jgi:hypothetical protein
MRGGYGTYTYNGVRVYPIVFTVSTSRLECNPCALRCGFPSLCAILNRYHWLVVWLCPFVMLHHSTMLDGRVNQIV